MWREIATTMVGEAKSRVAVVGVAAQHTKNIWKKKKIAKRKCEKFIQFGKNLGHSRGSTLEAPKAQLQQRHPWGHRKSSSAAEAIVSLSFAGEPRSY